MSTHVWLKLMSSKVQVWRNIERNLKNYFHATFKKYFLSSRCGENTLQDWTKRMLKINWKHSKNIRCETSLSRSQVIFYNFLADVWVKCTMMYFSCSRLLPYFLSCMHNHHGKMTACTREREIKYFLCNMEMKVLWTIFGPSVIKFN